MSKSVKKEKKILLSQEPVPDDILYDILIGLPLKSLIRFRMSRWDRVPEHRIATLLRLWVILQHIETGSIFVKLVFHFGPKLRTIWAQFYQCWCQVMMMKFERRQQKSYH
ncbi:hypothetical protein ACB098_05G072400 [Castanea mollissima]